MQDSLHAEDMPMETKDALTVELLEQSVFLWNMTFLPYDEAISKLLTLKRSPFSTEGLNMEEVILQKRYAEAIFGFIYERKHELFPDDTRFIISADVDVQPNKYGLQITSLDLKIHPFLLERFFGDDEAE
jgi:hypothetical protein